jgi:hypothetical protein
MLFAWFNHEQLAGVYLGEFTTQASMRAPESALSRLATLPDDTMQQWFHCAPRLCLQQ